MNSVSVEKVREIHARLKASGRTPAEVAMGTRTEVHEALQGVNEMPSAKNVTDQERIDADRARMADRNHNVDALHFMQRRHGESLWRETERLVAEAGVL